MLAASALLPRLALAQAASLDDRFSVMIWVLRKRASFEQNLETVAKAGYKHIELIGEFYQWTDAEHDPACDQRRHRIFAQYLRIDQLCPTTRHGRGVMRGDHHPIDTSQHGDFPLKRRNFTLAARQRLRQILDQSLCAREDAASGEELDRHVGESLELLLSFDDLGAVMLNDTLCYRV